MADPEREARKEIDAALALAGWVVQDAQAANLAAAQGVAIREFPLTTPYGFADYLLFVNGVAVGVIEAKKVGETLTGVEVQSEKYSVGLPLTIPSPVRPLPFLYQSTGVETRFTNGLDPDPRSRPVFHFHRPGTLAMWIAVDATTPTTVAGLKVAEAPGGYIANPTFLANMRSMPELTQGKLWSVQVKAVENLEQSLREGRPRALIQMATGSGKTFTAITSIYRLIKFGRALKVLFLVDRRNLGQQALKEFQRYVTPDDGRKFTELYNVQLMTSNRIDPVANVCITTIQRLFSMLKGEEELNAESEEGSLFDTGAGLIKAPVEVSYNPNIPIETFDIIFTDECHRSIYNLWRQVLEYFDAYIIGLTATPSKQTVAFFNQNLVMEYNHQQAVADGVNVDFQIYRIRTQITEQGAKLEAGVIVDKRDRQTRRVRWEELDEDVAYTGTELDRAVVAKDQIRTVIRTFRDKVCTEIFPGRTEVPKTLIYAKDDSHADDIVQIVREEFGKGNAFAEKITYRTGTVRVVEKKAGPDGKEYEEVYYKSAAGLTPEQLLASFRNSYNPRIVVTVDMIATGTDVQPLEIVMFMRSVKSRNYFEQMVGRGVRVIEPTDLQAVTPDAATKTHFVLVDCVGIEPEALVDTKPLEREPTVAFEKLLQAVAFGSTDADYLSSLASRLARLDRQLAPADRRVLQEAAGGMPLRDIVAGIVEALDPDRQRELARASAGLAPDAEPPDDQVMAAAQQLLKDAAAPLATNPALRQRLLEVKQRYEQIIDTVSQDVVLEAVFDEARIERDRILTRDFAEFIRQNKDSISALQVLYSRPYRQRLRRDDLKALAEAIGAPPRSWTTERLWRAYETLERSKVRGSPERVMTNLVSLVQFALGQERELRPFPQQVEQRFQRWLAQQEGLGRAFTDEQRWWLTAIKDHIAGNLEVRVVDLELSPFAQRGGVGKAYQVFGDKLSEVLDEMNRELVA